MKMNYAEWDDADKAPAKTRFVKNEIEISENRCRNLMNFKIAKLKREMTVLVVISTAISLVLSITIFRFSKRQEYFDMRR